MDKKYSTFGLEDFLEDRTFIAWVLRQQYRKEWSRFLEEHPDRRSVIYKAREIILLLRDSRDIPDEESVLAMWNNIEKFEKQHLAQTRKIVVRKTLGWAATILVITTLGIFGYLYRTHNEESYVFKTSEIPAGKTDARLILENGEEIALGKDNSTIELNSQNKLVINNDSIIDISPDSTGEIQMNEVLIPYGKRSELLLADGTKVWLNAGSRLAFPSRFSKKTREVFLEGEACFKVVKNDLQPFIVNTGDINIRVLGTWFDVSAYASDNSVETILLEGSVSIKHNTSLKFTKKELVLNPYQKASFNRETGKTVVNHEPDAMVAVAWTEGWFQFSGETLRSVFTRLQRYYNVDIKIPEGFPAGDVISGKLDLKDSLDEVMVALSDVAKINFRISENIVYIDKKTDKMKRK